MSEPEQKPATIRADDDGMKFLAAKALVGIEKPDYMLAAELGHNPEWASRLKSKYPDYHEVLLELVLRETRCSMNAPIHGVTRAASKGDSAAFERLMKFLGMWPPERVEQTTRHVPMTDEELERRIRANDGHG